MKKRKLHSARILTLDIETAPMVGLVWGTFKQFLGLNQVAVDWSILSYSAKWLGDKYIYYEDTGGQGEAMFQQETGVRNDSKLLKGLWNLLDNADIVVMQNGVRFDARKMNARFILAGMPPTSPYKVIDTMIEARKIFAFTSNRLAWLSEFLTDAPKDEHREFPGFELWLECLADNPKAWAAMKKYNRRDIVATEKVYLRLRPWIVGHPNVANYDDEEVIRCTKCGSTDVHPRGFYTTQAGKFQRYRCDSCDGWSRSRYTINSKAKRASLLVN